VTPQEIQFAALKTLGVVDVDETPEAEQGVLAASMYASLHAQLLTYGIATWALNEDVPAKAEQPVIWMLAFLCSTSEGFGAPPSRRDELAPMGALGAPQMSLAERQLRSVLAQPYVPQPAQADYY
jgi:hypothetical protein